uniref:Tyrosine-protein phosphatase domain-containing protein n=1 Tax=Rhabditophanes sp. KR3021 TaxID=114890 RepID=A0AC35UCF8_9BILA
MGQYEHLLDMKNRLNMNMGEYNMNKVTNSVKDSTFKAHYINGYLEPKRFIICDSPTLAEMNQFIESVVSSNVAIIVSMEALEQSYLPRNMNQSRSFCDGRYKLRLIASGRFKGGYNSSLLKVYDEKTGKQRKILHLQYLGWPDSDVPSCRDFVSFVKTVKLNRTVLSGGYMANDSFCPIMVHSSLGRNRCNTFITLDIMLSKLAHIKHQYNSVSEYFINSTPGFSLTQTVLAVHVQHPSCLLSPLSYLFICLALIEEIVKLGMTKKHNGFSLRSYTVPGEFSPMRSSEMVKASFTQLTNPR